MRSIFSACSVNNSGRHSVKRKSGRGIPVLDSQGINLLRQVYSVFFMQKDSMWQAKPEWVPPALSGWIKGSGQIN